MEEDTAVELKRLLKGVPALFIGAVKLNAKPAEIKRQYILVYKLFFFSSDEISKDLILM